MKELILKYLKADRSFEKGRDLYLQFGNKLSFKKQLNGQPENEHLKGVLMEELRQIADIDPKQFKIILQNKPVVVNIVKTEEKITTSDPAELAVQLLQEAKNRFEKGDLLKVRNLINEAFALLPAGEVPAEYSNFIEHEFNYFNRVQDLPTTVKATIKLREEFPFLKKSDCPEQLKVLVTDMVTAYDAYKAAHEALFTAENDEQLLKASEAVVLNVIENQSIWKELNHYKETGTILGEHPIFKTADFQAEFTQLNMPELVNKEKNLSKSLSKYLTGLEKNEKPHLRDAHLLKVEELKVQLSIVRKLIGYKD